MGENALPYVVTVKMRKPVTKRQGHVLQDVNGGMKGSTATNVGYY